MSALDRIHNAVKNALVKDGWTITDDPFTIEYDEVTVFADLAAERPVAAERAGRMIVVEIKTFGSPSPVRDFEQALGQYQLYKGLLEVTAPEYKVYLAVSEEAYLSIFSQNAIQLLARRFDVSLLVVNVATEVVVQWIG